jgi:hypothetical protein
MPVEVDVDATRVIRALNRVDKSIGKAVRELGKEAAQIVVDDVPGQSLTRQQRAALGGLTAGGDLISGFVRLRSTGGRPFVVAAFMGARQRTGWYANPKFGANHNRRNTSAKQKVRNALARTAFASGALGRQFPPWVGNQYDLGDGEGPYGIGPAIRDNLPRIRELHNDRLLDVFRSEQFDTDN